LFDDTLDSNDGVAQYVKTVGAWLSAQGYNVIYLVGQTKLRSWRDAPIYSLAKNQTVTFNGNRVSTPWPASKRNIKAVLAKHQIDVLHVQVPFSPFFAGRVINLVDRNTAVVGTFHIYPAGPVARFGTRLLKLLCIGSLKRFLVVLSVSPAAAEFAAWAFGLRTIASSNVVELDRYAAAAGGKLRQKKIVFLGRLVPRKGAEELLRAFMLLKANVPTASLVIAGDGPQRTKLEAIVKENGLQSSVRLPGFISEDDKPDLLAGAAIACFPSLHGESFGIVLIEAMAAGAGVVLGGANPGYKTVLGGRPETLVDPKNTRQFAKRLEKFLTDAQLAAQIHSWQQSHVKRYDINEVGPSLVKVYYQAIAKQRPLGDN